MKFFSCLKRNEQLLIERPSDREMRNGPGVVFFPPMICKTQKSKATLLAELEYTVVTDTLSGVQRTEVGPQLLFLGAYDEAGSKINKVVLEKDEYVKVLDSKTGEVRVVRGPEVFVPSPTESTPNGTEKAVILKKHEYVRLTDTATGVMRVERGEQLVFPTPMEVMDEKHEAFQLKKNQYVKLVDSATGVIRVEMGESIVFPTPTETAPEGPKLAVSLKRQEYVRLTDAATGKMRIEKGEQLVVPGPMETLEPKQDAFRLRKNDYVRLIDKATGFIRVEVGEQIVFPSPTEEALGPVNSAVNVDNETAVLVVNNESGQQRLVTQKGLFLPGALDEILEVRKLIRVEPHEVAIVCDNDGNYTFHDGAANGGQGTAFFLPPHCQLVTMYWSSGTSQEDLKNKIVRKVTGPAHKVPVTKIDLRSQYAFFEYNVRTSDNVELVLEGTVFWQVADVPKMIHATGDPKGDVWYHARSALIQAVSCATLETFMAKFNEIVTNATSSDDKFYSERGVVVHTVEVTRYECVDAATSAVLQEVIQETTNRMNRMQQQQSQNDVLKEQLNGEIELEKQRSELIHAKSDNDRMKAIIEGESQGLRLAKNAQTFLSTLDKELPDADARLSLFKFFEEQQMSTTRAEHLASGSAHIFLTPQDMNLKLNMSGQ